MSNMERHLNCCGRRFECLSAFKYLYFHVNLVTELTVEPFIFARDRRILNISSDRANNWFSCAEDCVNRSIFALGVADICAIRPRKWIHRCGYRLIRKALCLVVFFLNYRVTLT